jgi:hypothetical protein
MAMSKGEVLLLVLLLLLVLVLLVLLLLLLLLLLVLMLGVLLMLLLLLLLMLFVVPALGVIVVLLEMSVGGDNDVSFVMLRASHSSGAPAIGASATPGWGKTAPRITVAPTSSLQT